jgi:hypothetical protein
MIRVLGSPRRLCDGLTRRELLQVAAATTLGGLAAPRARATSGPRPGQAKHVIVLYLLGGAATQDMFDLKPAAPAEIRGEFRPVPTSAPGVQVCEHLLGLARWMHRAALVRSVNHQAGCHNTLPSFTGLDMTLPDIVSTRETYPPGMGAVIEYLSKAGAAGDRSDGRSGGGLNCQSVFMPCYLGWGQAIRRPGPYAGFLGQRYDPLFTECSPYIDAKEQVEKPWYPQVLRGVPRLPDSVLPEDITLDRLNARRSLARQLDDRLREHDRAAAPGGAANFERHRRRAFDLLTSAKLKAAFDLSREDPRRLDRYGRTLFGNSALIARRLVEAGSRFVTVT